VWVIFLLAARAPVIDLDVKWLAVLGQCAQGRPPTPHPGGKGGREKGVAGKKFIQCAPVGFLAR